MTDFICISSAFLFVNYDFFRSCVTVCGTSFPFRNAYFIGKNAENSHFGCSPNKRVWRESKSAEIMQEMPIL